MAGRRPRYSDLPPSLLGSPGALGRFKVRPMIDAWAVFPFLVAALGTLLAIGWARRFIALMGPD